MRATALALGHLGQDATPGGELCPLHTVRGWHVKGFLKSLGDVAGSNSSL